jgi:hypothetical protein
MWHFSFLLHLLFFCCLSGQLKAQILLENSSFEGDPVDATVPEGWQPCKPGTTPDILPGPWSVKTAPEEGQSYMGLITRGDGTWESVGQRLKEPIKARECYTFSLSLARSNTYAEYNWPLRLRIWGGKQACSKDVLLAETESIEHLDWQRYNFEFFSQEEVHFIILEAYYAPGVYFHYNGNILLDNCSPINPCTRASLDRETIPSLF